MISGKLSRDLVESSRHPLPYTHDPHHFACLPGQIGQVMLTLPHAVALVGLKSAIPLMILYGIIST